MVRRDEAIQDLEDHYLFIAQDSLASANRFLTGARAAFRQLAGLPLMGKRTQFRDPLLADVQQWSVPGFPYYLIFYRPIERGVEVLRVIHGSRDLRRIFGE